MNRRIVTALSLAALLLLCSDVFGQQADKPVPSTVTQWNGEQHASLVSANATDAATSSAGQGTAGKPAAPAGHLHKLGPLNLTVNWRLRAEGWDWFHPPTGQNAYGLEHSLLRVGIGQKFERFEWLLEGAQDSILGLPKYAVEPAPLGQLGLGGTYYAANGSTQNIANGFVKQAYASFDLPAQAKLRLGRFTFLDGTEVAAKDKTVATLVNTRISQRLIGDFGFSAVNRSYDGVQLGVNAGGDNVTLLAARPTRGVYQIDGMGEVSVDLFYGAYTAPVSFQNNAGQFRIFAIGYVDERGTVPKTDNRSAGARAADINQIRIGTYGLDYVHVIHTDRLGQWDFLGWGVVQDGAWGTLTQHAGAFVGEMGWQPPVRVLNPWFSTGYSYGSGDSNPGDTKHATFFQLLPTPRPYARFPFYNMMNNQDFYAMGIFRLPHSFTLRSEGHALRLASAQDLWYTGGGAFQPHTFGYTGRPSGGSRSLANVLDVSVDFPLGYGFTITTYYAHAWGKSVIANIYPGGPNGQFGYVETNYRF